MSVTSWFLVSSSGTRHRLPREMIFVGREDCELMLQSRSVDKQHAVINYNPATDEHLVKDLGSLNGTFVNDLRIPDQIYMTLKLSDVIRFGYDSHVYVLEKSQHKVPEEALKHEKYTSQLQMGLRASEGKRAEHLDDKSKLEKTDRKSLSQETPTSRPTPLYGQPSWWGEEDAASKRQHSEGHRSEEGHPEIPKEGSALDSEVNGSLLEYRDAQGKSSFSYHREPSYFEIPTKEFQLHPKSPGAELHEIPTKDTDTPHAPPTPTSPTPPVVQSHASFTIEFDDCTPGKIKIKDHVTKFSSRQRKQQQVSGKTLATTPTEVMSAECKVADWLVHSDVRMMRRRPTCEDVYSVKSDQAVNIKSLKGHHHDDGTQSDSEDPVLGKGKRRKSHHRIQSQHSIQSELSQSELSEPSQQTVRSYQLVQSQQTVQSHHSIQSDQSVPSQQTVLSVQPHQTVQSDPSQMLLQPHFSPPKLTPVSPVVPERPLSESPPEVGSPTMGRSKPNPQEPLSQQAFIIEFFDNPRKKRSQSFTANPAHADSYSTLKAKLERRKGGERPNSMHGHMPPTQQVTVPLKGHGGPLRSSSLKREKTEEPLSGGSASSSSGSGPSSRTSSGITIKPFGSVGKKSKLAQEFAAEFLMKDAAHRALSPTRDKTSPPMSAPPVMMMSPSRTRIPSPLDPPSSVSYPSTPLQTTAPRSYSPTPAPHSPALALSQPPSRSPVQTASPVRSAVPSTTPLMPLGLGVVRNEEEDSLSDAGTYTIETESQDKEVEEARNMIDQVFGVLDSPEYSGAGVYRPIINDGKDEPAMLRPSDASTVDQMKAVSMHGFNPAALSGAPSGPFQFPPLFQVPSSNTAAQEEGPKWVSRWASLADSCAEPGSTPPQGEFAEGDLRLSRLMPSHSVDNSESEASQSCRIRRLLPQVPPGDKDKPESPTPSILIRHEPPYPGPETPLERSSGTPRHQDSTQRLCVQDDVDPDSLSDASRSDDGSVLERTRKSQERTSGATSPGDTGPHYRGQDKLSPSQPTKSTSFYIGSEECSLVKPDLARSPFLSQGPERGRDIPAKTSPTTVLIRHLSSHEPRRLGIKPNSSAPNLHSQQDKESKDPSKDSLGTSSFVRQESFTKEQPSDDIQIKRLPHISSHPTLRDMEQRRETAKDPQPFLRDAADASLSSLEVKLPSSGSGHSSKRGGSSSHMDDSLSGESDVDTASTVSLVSNKNTPVTTGPKKRTAARSSSSPSVQEKGHRQPTARERLSEKRRSHAAAGDNSSSKAEQAKRFQMRRSTGNCGSLDLSEDQQSSGQHWPDTASDHETSSRPASRNKKLIAPLQKEDNGKTAKSAAQQALIRSNSLSAPRPTRASMLRRARLEETSDNDGTETDRGSQNSDHIGAPSKVSADGKKLLSRLDILAMPRKRAGSFTTPSDNESSITTPSTRPGFSNRSAESTGPVRKTSVGEAGAKQGVTRGSGAPGKQPFTRSSGTKYSSTTSSRQRQKGSDYTSTSEEEYEASSGTPKHKRSSHMSAATQTPRAQKEKAAAEVARSKSGSLELEEDEVQNEDDHYQNWTTHSAEIAKLSQDLAKDLAILAREIHDVAGDGDSQSSSGMGTNPSPSSAPNTPGPASTIPISSREEVILDNLMLNPVSQLSQAIRENTEQLAEKMKVLFHNKTEAWEEIEAKINAENEVPILKTSNKEISSILNELRRVQKQLEMINSIVEPGGAGSGNPKVAAVATAASGGQATRSPSRQKKSPSKPTGPGDRQRGAGPSTSPTTSKPNANESTKRTTRGPKGANLMA
ncbi:centrosomal protein of 170 kDa protein B-like isoform X4 [Salvelinus fontinalis]|uniref:centrosomal protein of 170 kDa protein B-like isoform X4 n=1 Tax=Salvelinus fontinalis TaxID=8038 RepID=UPI0024867AC9|nr:centrosomal protein of 170 kDa protein B-like isoform X4 [Salvelinus fontinalis]